MRSRKTLTFLAIFGLTKYAITRDKLALIQQKMEIKGRFVACMSKLAVSVKSQPHKQRIWFFPDTKAKAKKPKELFFAKARTDKRVEKVT